MAFSNQFEKALDGLFRQRTHWLRTKLGDSKPGKPPEFSRKKVNVGIEKLQDIASKAFAPRLARKGFEKHITIRKLYHIKGHGREDKKKRFNKWYDNYFNPRRGYVYSFWKYDKTCIYVGRTGSGGSRPSGHFEKFWFSQAKRITVFQLKSKSQIPKIECLAIHHFQPRRNKNKASTKKWTKACPLCEKHRLIEKELHRIFRFK